VIHPRSVRLPMTRRAGIVLALATACISGVAVFVNGYAVQRVPSASVYTTAKNLVAAAILCLGVLALRRADVRTSLRRLDRTRVAALGAVGALGGGVAFILFFEGLRHAGSTQAAFLQKTLVLWVAFLAIPLLRERIGLRHVAAIGALLVGQVALSGDLTTLRHSTTGELMVLAATLIWAGEVVVVRALLRSVPSHVVGVARMGVGVVVLSGYLAVSGNLGALFALDAAGWGMALLTGVILAGYVTTWFAALARAHAVDVTAVLVLGAFVTALLDAGVKHVALAPRLGGLALLVAGGALVVLPRLRGRRQVLTA
jgi:drug/metabolite transporter (DMT)-like permease